MTEQRLLELAVQYDKSQELDALVFNYTDEAKVKKALKQLKSFDNQRVMIWYDGLVEGFVQNAYMWKVLFRGDKKIIQSYTELLFTT